MIVYSVTVNIAEDVHEVWLKWMKEQHIPDVMATGIFTSHQILKVLTKAETEEGVTYNIQYACQSMKDLHHYQAQHAPRLQKEHSEKFENKFVAFRTLLEKA